jgi:hypothetical protein
VTGTVVLGLRKKAAIRSDSLSVIRAAPTLLTASPGLTPARQAGERGSTDTTLTPPPGSERPAKGRTDDELIWSFTPR